MALSRLFPNLLRPRGEAAMSPDARHKRGLGRRGERAAARHLRRAGYRVLARNVRTSQGEADLVCLAPDRRTIVVVEVKARLVPKSRDPSLMPLPELRVNPRKQSTLLAIARSLARSNGWFDRPLRVDVVGVDLPQSGKPVVRHYEDAVRTGRR